MKSIENHVQKHCAITKTFKYMVDLNPRIGNLIGPTSRPWEVESELSEGLFRDLFDFHQGLRTGHLDCSCTKTVPYERERVKWSNCWEGYLDARQ